MQKARVDFEEEMRKQKCLHDEKCEKNEDDEVREGMKASNTKAMENECIICFEEFTPFSEALKNDKSRKKEYLQVRSRLYPCSHTNLCLKCAKDIWTRKLKPAPGKNSIAKCPMCRTKMASPPLPKIDYV